MSDAPRVTLTPDQAKDLRLAECEARASQLAMQERLRALECLVEQRGRLALMLEKNEAQQADALRGANECKAEAERLEAARAALARGVGAAHGLEGGAEVGSDGVVRQGAN